jgi:hypothetical protein
MSRQNEWLKKKFKELKIQFGGKCQNELCSRESGLEFAHRHDHGTKLNGRGRGRRERYYDVKNHPDSYVLLCHGCHEHYDVGMKIPIRGGGD